MISYNWERLNVNNFTNNVGLLLRKKKGFDQEKTKHENAISRFTALNLLGIIHFIIHDPIRHIQELFRDILNTE